MTRLFPNAFIAAKGFIQTRFVTFANPWAPADYDRVCTLLGKDFWSYHFEPNQHVLETFLSYSYDQGILLRKVEAPELFAASTLELSKI